MLSNLILPIVMVNRVTEIKNTPYPYLTVGPVKKNPVITSTTNNL